MEISGLPVWDNVMDARGAVWQARQRGESIGFVPTMGALHEGHAELIRVAKDHCDFVVVSVFVNPTQFGPKEDFHKYPRTLEADCELSLKCGASGVFAPTVQEMYPERSVSFVEVLELDKELCGPSRPGHFRGVCTVVAKLFNIIQADMAFFGQKDAQQLRIINQMVRDLNFPIEIVGVPTVREADGLAMSSRNRYLSAPERAEAPKIYAALKQLQKLAKTEHDVAKLETSLQGQLQQIPGSRLDYARIVDDVSLQPITRLERPALAAVAVFLGTTRLIDNVTLSGPG